MNSKNIINKLRTEKEATSNELEWILKSYDEQSGSYIEASNDNSLTERYHIDGVRTKMKRSDFYRLHGEELSKIINNFNYKSLLEVGVGEATKLMYIIKNKPSKDIDYSGLDISLSRISYGKEYLENNNCSYKDLLVGDMFNIPYDNDSFDIVYTSHAIESNTNKSLDALNELYRVTKKYLILVEPDYKLGNKETREWMRKHKYIVDLYDNIISLGYKVIKHELFKYGSFTNQSSIIIIEKENQQDEVKSTQFYCPCCKQDYLSKTKEKSYYCIGCKKIFPIISDVPILLKEKGILFGKVNKFIV